MSNRFWICARTFIIALCVIWLSACSQSGSVITKSPAAGGIAMPFAVSTLPSASDLKATLTCPDGSTVTMIIDPASGTTSGSCTDMPAGTNQTINIDFTYTFGTTDLKLASASKTVDVVQGQSTPVTFAAADYDESFDADGDGYPNLYELTNDMDASNSATDSGFSTITTSLHSARAGHTATHLPNGTVLLTGGTNDGTTVLDSAEIYDPQTNRITPLSNHLYSPRTNHTAIPLPDGTVLITGGQATINGPAINSAELYDPVAQTFTPLTNSAMQVNREGHSATLLPNGNVLIAGGSDSTKALSNAELYNYNKQSFTVLSATLNTARSEHSATLLSNGQVLLAGGYNKSDGTLRSAEVYDPEKKTFTRLSASLTRARACHSATRLPNGHVLLMGGYDADTGTYLDSFEIYNPTTNSFMALNAASSPTLPTATANAAAQMLPNGSVLITGGMSDGSIFLNTMVAYQYPSATLSSHWWTWMGGNRYRSPFLGDPGNGVYGEIGKAADGNIPGERPGAVTWTDAYGRLWLFGGSGTDANSNSGAFNDLWRYDPATQQWAWMSGSSTVGAAGNYVVKGSIDQNNVPGARVNAVSWIDNSGRLWLFGGSNNNDLWYYDPTYNEWAWMSGSSTPGQPGVYGTVGISDKQNNFPGARSGAVSWIDDYGQLWLFGGKGYDTSSTSTGYLNDLWRYNPATNEWTWMSGSSTAEQPGVYGTIDTPDKQNNFPGGRDYATSWTDASGQFWLFGGYTDLTGSSGAPSGSLNDLWGYNPTLNEWTWMSGSDTVNSPSKYGIQGQAASQNVPGARSKTVSWIDAYGQLWLLGGVGADSGGTTNTAALNDLWRYDPATNQWTWMSGANTIFSLGSFGTKGIADASNVPGARDSAVSWVDTSGHLWMFGGHLFITTLGSESTSYYNDLWRYQP